MEAEASLKARGLWSPFLPRAAIATVGLFERSDLTHASPSPLECSAGRSCMGVSEKAGRFAALCREVPG